MHSVCSVLLIQILKLQMLTGQFANQPTRGQLNCGLIHSWISQLAESEFLIIIKKTILYLYNKPNPTLTNNDGVKIV